MSTTIPAKLVKELRERTGAGMMDCKRALEESAGDLDAATTSLRVKGLADAAKRAGRATNEGLIDSYIHQGGRVGVLVEVNCESDFVARTEQFQELVRALALQVASANPTYVAREDVPAAVIEREKDIYRQQLADQKKPPQVLDKIIEGKLGKFYEEACLLDQAYVRDASGKTRVKDVVGEVSGKTGEKIAVRRFVRYQVGSE
jgi:elongation factor Ts